MNHLSVTQKVYFSTIMMYFDILKKRKFYFYRAHLSHDSYLYSLQLWLFGWSPWLKHELHVIILSLMLMFHSQLSRCWDICLYLYMKCWVWFQRPPSSSLSAYGGPVNDDVRSPGSGGTPGPLSQPPASQQSLDNSDPGKRIISYSRNNVCILFRYHETI